MSEQSSPTGATGATARAASRSHAPPSHPDIKGLFPALALPFDDQLNLLEREFIVHVQRVAHFGPVGGVVVNGHAGEVTTLSEKERRRVVELAREAAPPGFPIVAGVEALSLTRAVDEARVAVEAGADALLVFPPFDYFPRRGATRNPEAPYQFFKELADAVRAPLVVFNYPHWTGVSYTTDTLVQLADIEEVICVKNAVWSVPLYVEQYRALQGRVRVMAACDGPELLAMMMFGADGALIGVSNVGTKLWGEFVEGCLAGRFDSVRELFVERLEPLAHGLFGDLETSASSFNALTKSALVQLGLFSTHHVRPPELVASDADAERVTRALVKAGLVAEG